MVIKYKKLFFKTKQRDKERCFSNWSRRWIIQLAPNREMFLELKQITGSIPGSATLKRTLQLSPFLCS